MSVSPHRITPAIARRLWMTGIGALAGLAAWLLLDVVPEFVRSERALLFGSTAAGGFFIALLAAGGTLPFRRALGVAVGASLPGAALLTWASLRYDRVDPFLESGHAALAYGLICALSLPFLMVGLRGKAPWHSYPALFRQAWEIVVRGTAALIFLGIFWAVVFLSDALFGLVGLPFISLLLDINPVPPLLTGAVIGLALAVVVELEDYGSPHLILRLLQLFLPVVLAVTAVFLAALPFRGVSGLFGALSAAAVLLSMAVGIATLITAAIERDDDAAAGSPVLRVSAQLLALAMPVLAGLALYAVLLRVGQYGWSPDRLAAACAGGVGLGYGGLYAVSVLARRHWMARIRRANTWMALCVIAVAALWLTPVLNPERISARDQVARFASGSMTVEELDLWFLGRELGVAGDRVLDDLAALDRRDAAALADRIAALRAAGSRFEFDRVATDAGAQGDLDAVLALAVVRPGGAEPLVRDDLTGVRPEQLARWARACAPAPDDRGAMQPGCVALRADLLPDAPGDELLFFWRGVAGTRVLALWRGSAKAPMVLRGAGGTLPNDTLRRLLEGAYRLGPPTLQSLDLGQTELILLP